MLVFRLAQPKQKNVNNLLNKTNEDQGEVEKLNISKENNVQITVLKGMTSTNNRFLKSANFPNNSENCYSCVKCEFNFASEEFLNIYIGATYKMKCEIYDFETGHRSLLKEHFKAPGIWHKQKGKNH